MSSLCQHLYTIDKCFDTDLLERKQESICNWCDHKGSNLWLCLFKGCLKVGCGESSANHSQSHNNDIPCHCIAINLSNLKVWCYMCEMEVTCWVIRKLGINPSQLHLGNQISSSGVAVAHPATPNDSSADDDEDKFPLEEDFKPKGLVGLRNLGLTCYMNAALQALSNSVPLACFMKDCSAFLRSERKQPGIVQPFHKLIEEIWHPKRPSYLAPSVVYHSFRTLYPMFRPYTQQDSQEFLRYFMDQLHEELRQPHQPLKELQSEDIDLDISDDDYQEMSSESLSDREDTPQDSQEESSGAEDYETCDSGVSDQSTDRSSLQHKSKRRRKRSPPNIWNRYSLEDQCEFSDAMSDTSLLDGKNPKDRFDSRSLLHASSCATSGLGSSKPSVLSLQSCMSKSSNSMQNKGTTPRRKKSLSLSSGMKKKKQIKYRSIISDCFDGVLVSSVQCLTCNTTSSRKETFQDLSLPIPSSDQLTLLHQHPTQQIPHSSSIPIGQNSSFNIYLTKNACDVSGSGWMRVWMWSVWGWMKSWIWGPSVSLFNCLAAFFSADELKGDNMYSCEKCGKLRNGVKYSKVIQLPEVLIIHLKRFRHEYMFSSKISQYVSFPMYGLDLSPFLHKDCSSDIRCYDLYSVICHHGAVGSGHYTSYAQNVSNNAWYEFDDQCVTEVSLETVANCEAYVLFYKKSSPEMVNRRQRTMELMQVSSHEPSLMQFYISKQWINKFNTFTDPGPVDNSDFLCIHGGVQPLKSHYVEDLVMIFSQGVWEYLHQSFGGGPACTSLFECVTCKEEQDALMRRQKSEYESFIDLHSKFQKEEQPSIVFAISMRWFRTWEAFVRGHQQEPPGPLDNSSISAIKHEGPKPGSDYAPISKNLWNFFHGIYGGGPEIFVCYGIQDISTHPRREAYDVADSTCSEITKPNITEPPCRLVYGLKSLSTDDLPYSVSLNQQYHSGIRQRTLSASQGELVGKSSYESFMSVNDDSSESSNRKVIRWSDVEDDDEGEESLVIDEALHGGSPPRCRKGNSPVGGPTSTTKYPPGVGGQEGNRPRGSLTEGPRNSSDEALPGDDKGWRRRPR